MDEIQQKNLPSGVKSGPVLSGWLSEYVAEVYSCAELNCAMAERLVARVVTN